MKNNKFNEKWEFEEYRDVGGINGDEGSTLPHAKRHGANTQVPRQYVRHAKMRNEVPMISKESESLGLDIENIDDEGDEGI
jgi:hypothetical protein